MKQHMIFNMQNKKITLALSFIFISMVYTSNASAFGPKRLALNEYPDILCTSLEKTRSSFEEKLTTREHEQIKKLSIESQKQSDARKKIDTNRDLFAKKKDLERNTLYAKLLQNTETVEEREAVELFRKTVEEAVTTRRITVATIQKEYRDSLDALLEDQKKILGEKILSVKKDGSEFIRTKQLHCRDGEQARTLLVETKESFQQNLKRNKEETRMFFVQQLQTIEETRREQLQSTNMRFKKTVSEAETRLREILNK